MFADYRVPQILNSWGCIMYSPLLEHTIRSKKTIPSGHMWEIQLRGRHPWQVADAKCANTESGCSIWCVELIRKDILRRHPDAMVNAVLIDFFLYDTMKEYEKTGTEEIPHHRTRSIWY